MSWGDRFSEVKTHVLNSCSTINQGQARHFQTSILLQATAIGILTSDAYYTGRSTAADEQWLDQHAGRPRFICSSAARLAGRVGASRPVRCAAPDLLLRCNGSPLHGGTVEVWRERDTLHADTGAGARVPSCLGFEACRSGGVGDHPPDAKCCQPPL